MTPVDEYIADVKTLARVIEPGDECDGRCHPLVWAAATILRDDPQPRLVAAPTTLSGEINR